MSNEKLIVPKFGGSSIADRESVKLVMGIMDHDLRRSVVVVSAPGRNGDNPEKVTDLLLRRDIGSVIERFSGLANDLGWENGRGYIDLVGTQLRQKDFRDYRLSRGEWITAHMIADLTGSEFVDATNLIHVNADRTIDQIKSAKLIGQFFEGKTGRFVVPGFYGLDNRGYIRTLERDGSDITGAMLAKALRANVFEIFSDTNGVFDSDPNMNNDAVHIPDLTFSEYARQASKIVHPSVIEILWKSKVDINCRNTYNEKHPGTWIRHDK